MVDSRLEIRNLLDLTTIKRLKKVNLEYLGISKLVWSKNIGLFEIVWSGKLGPFRVIMSG